MRVASPRQRSQSPGPAERARAKSRFFPRFVSFQGFAKGKISLSVVTPIPCSTRRARDRGRTRGRLRSSRVPTLSRLAARGPALAMVRNSSPRSVRCRLSRVVSATPEVKPGRSKTLAWILVFRKWFWTLLSVGDKFPTANSTRITRESGHEREALLALHSVLVGAAEAPQRASADPADRPVPQKRY